ncbi:MAG: energy transducer TonB [Acidobacteriota bacterium]
MFEHSFVGVTGKTQRGWPVVASLTIQFSLVGAALLVPVLNPQILPRAVWAALPLAAPPPPAPPPAGEPEARAAVKAVRGVMDAARPVLPRAIPPKAAMIDDSDFVAAQAGVRGGVQGGMEGGVADGVVRAVMDAAQAAAPPPVAAHEAQAAKPKEPIRVRRGGEVQEAMLVHRVLPAYPPLARQARIEGKVVFKAVISAEGLIQSLQLVSGHPLLVEAAREAVRQWRYRPTLLNGRPCEVDTVIEVNFTLQR